MVFSTANVTAGQSAMRPGPVRLSIDNRTEGRILPGVFVAGPALEALLGGRRPFLSAKRLLTNQTFRDLYRTDTLSVEQRLKDHEPHVPVHRFEGLDGTLRARRRSRGL